MSKFFKISVSSILVGIMILSAVCFATKNISAPYFVLEKFKMKLGSTQAITGVIKGDYDWRELESSDASVIKITSDGYLKAVSTGYSTLRYTYRNDDDEKTTITCHVEVTRNDSTFANVGGGVAKQDVFITVNLGDYNVIISSASGAVPTFPKFEKKGEVFGGLYYDSSFANKVGEKDRFNSDRIVYAKFSSNAEQEKAEVPSEFYDDINGHWSRNAVEALTYKGLFSGVAERTFGPDVTMTRAMAITVLGRLDGADVSGEHCDLSDVPSNSYYDGYVAWGIDNQVIGDVKDGKFRPNDEITREEIAVYIANYIKYHNYEYEAYISVPFWDLGDVSATAKDDIEILYNIGIIKGNGNNTFSPKSSATRAEMAQIFFNLYNYTMKSK